MNEVAAARARLRVMGEAELDELCQRHGVRVLTLFGSAADPDDDEPGDLDLGVVFQPGADHDLLGPVAKPWSKCWAPGSLDGLMKSGPA